jgi:hypothetical protein
MDALKFLAWTTPNAQIRNYYLSEAQKVQLNIQSRIITIKDEPEPGPQP